MDWAKPTSLAKRRREEMAQFLRPDAAGEAVENVPVARALVLQHRAKVSKKAVRTHAASSAGTVVAGAAAVATLAHTHHSHVAWWIGGLALIGAAIDGFVAIGKQAKATTLAANASKQVTAPAAPISATAMPITKA